AAGGANHESGEAGVVEERDEWGTQLGGQAEQAAEARGIAKDGQEVLRVGLLVSEAGGSQRGLAAPEGKQAFGGGRAAAQGQGDAIAHEGINETGGIAGQQRAIAQRFRPAKEQG